MELWVQEVVTHFVIIYNGSLLLGHTVLMLDGIPECFARVKDFNILKKIISNSKLLSM